MVIAAFGILITVVSAHSLNKITEKSEGKEKWKLCAVSWGLVIGAFLLGATVRWAVIT